MSQNDASNIISPYFDFLLDCGFHIAVKEVLPYFDNVLMDLVSNGFIVRLYRDRGDIYVNVGRTQDAYLLASTGDVNAAYDISQRKETKGSITIVGPRDSFKNGLDNLEEVRILLLNRDPGESVSLVEKAAFLRNYLADVRALFSKAQYEGTRRKLDVIGRKRQERMLAAMLKEIESENSSK